MASMSRRGCIVYFLRLLMMVLLTACSLAATPDQRCMDRILRKTAQSMSKEGFEYRGMGVASEGPPEHWMRVLTIDLQYAHLVQQGEARALLFRAARELRDQINNADCAGLLFSELPVDASKIGVVLFFREPSEDRRVFPFIHFAVFKDGKLRYYSNLSKDSLSTDHEYHETLEEALEKLGESQF